MALSPQQEKQLNARRTVYNARDSVEGDALLTLLDMDIAAAQAMLLGGRTADECFRAQGHVLALTKFRKYLTEPMITDRT